MAKGIISYPEELIPRANDIGKKRFELNKERRNGNNKYNPGDEVRALEIEIQGALGELIIDNFLWVIGIEHEYTKPVQRNPASTWDIKLSASGQTIDVKTSGVNTGEYLIKKENHNKAKGVSHYCLVHLLGSLKANYWVFPMKYVEAWSEKFVFNNQCYYRPFLADYNEES